MTKAEFDKLFYGIIEDLKKTREAGQKEYAHGEVDNVFNNFIRVSNDIQMPKEKVLWTYLAKHLDGIKAYLNGHKSQREDVRGRILDSIVYLMLFWGMVEDNEKVNSATFDGTVTSRIPAGQVNYANGGLGIREDLAHDR